MNKISIVISTRQYNEEYYKHIRKSFSHPKNQILIYENDNKYSLSEIYNKGLNDSENDIVVFIHDDLIFETTNITPKIIKLFQYNPRYGIIGLAGTTNLISGKWWEDRDSMIGQVKHQKDGKTWLNKYSETFGEFLKEVVLVDGLFIAVNKQVIKHKFDEDFKGFHFYDLGFCLPNYLNNVKIGVTTKIKVIHKSIGEVNKQWEKYKLLFEAKYEKNFPIKIYN